MIVRADAAKLPLPGRSVDLVLGSPPWTNRRTYDIKAKRKMYDWVAWMFQLTERALDVCRGPVLWVVAGHVEKSCYYPACEMLMTDWHSYQGHCERPLIWHKNAPPNRKDWFGNDWSYVLVFKRRGPVPYFDGDAIGTPPKYTSGGDFRQRGVDGKRRAGSTYPQRAKTHPRDVIRATVGGGHMGSKLAHENEAPYPESLVEPLIKALCPVGGIVLDPFSGSGTTAAVALKLGRRAIAMDIRQNQCVLTRRRIGELGKGLVHREAVDAP